MQKREKILALALLGIVGAWKVLPMAWGVVYGPIASRESTAANLRSKLETQRSQERQIFDARAGLADARQVSLPGDPLDAQRLYLRWINDLVEREGFSEIKVTLISGGGKAIINKDTVHVPIGVTVEGAATMSQVRNALYRFYQANLLQRVVSLSLTSDRAMGDPRLVVKWTVEGSSVVGVPTRKTLFAEGKLSEGIDGAATTVSVESASGMPEKAPFRVRIGKELLNVTGVEGANWTVERGVDGTEKLDHAKSATVELSDVSPRMAGKTLESFAVIVERNMFAKPTPPRTYQPELKLTISGSVAPGAEFSQAVRLSDYDPSLGKPAFGLVNPPTGMTIDPATGRIVWKVPADFVPADVPITVTADLDKAKEKPFIKSEFKIPVKLANSAPQIAEISEQRIPQGQPWQFDVKGTDTESKPEELTFAIEGAAPAGMTIDPKGKLTWFPGMDQKLGNHDVTVKVTDKGTPPMSATRKMTIVLEMDRAKFTELVGIVSTGGGFEAWLRDKSKNQMTELRDGMTFDLGGMKGTVVKVSRTSMIFKKDQDETEYRMKLGDNLRVLKRADGKPIPGIVSIIVPAGANVVQPVPVPAPNPATPMPSPGNQQPAAAPADVPAAQPASVTPPPPTGTPQPAPPTATKSEQPSFKKGG